LKQKDTTWLPLPIATIMALSISDLLPQQSLSGTYLSTHILAYGLESTRYHFASYAVIVSTFFVYTFFLLYTNKNSKNVFQVSKNIGLFVFTGVAFFIVFIELSLIKFLLVLLLFLFGFSVQKKQIILSAFTEMLPRHFGKLCLSVFCFAYFILFYLLPLFFRLSTPRVDDLYSFESHYAGTVLPGAEWAKGQTVFRLNYGFWMTFAIGSSYKLIRLVGFSPPSLQFLVQIFQLLTMLAILLTLFFLNRKSYLLLITVALFLLTPYLNTAAVWSPNQTGIRYLPFLGGIWLIVWIAKKSDLSIVSTAGTFALLALGSPDTVVPLLAGYIFFRVLVEYQENRNPFLILKSLTLFLGTFVIALFSLAALLNWIFDLAAGWNLFEFLKLFASGYGGFSDQPTPVAGILISFASYFVLRGVFRARQKSLTRLDALQSSLAVMILAWFPYYVNRMIESNLWFQLVLLLFMISPSLRKIQFDNQILFKKFDLRYTMSFIAIAALLVTTLHNSLSLVEYYRSKISNPISCTMKDITVSSICLKNYASSDLSSQVRHLEEIPDKKQFIVLSRVPTHVRGLGYNRNFPWYDTMSEVVNEDEVRAVAAWIDRFGPTYLLVDDAKSASLYSENSLSQQKYLATRLQNYKFLSNQNSWDVYVRR
jgi:hypothetical protein